MKRNQWVRRLVSFALAIALMLTSMGVQSLASYAEEIEIDESLTVPFGIGTPTYDAGQGIGFDWGQAGYEGYTVTVECEELGYKEVYANQNLAYHWYAGEYVAGKTYTVYVQGEKDGKLSPAGTTTVTIPGGNTEGGSTEGGNNTTPETPAVTPETVKKGFLDLNWISWTGEGGAANITDVTSDGATINVLANGSQNYAIQFCAEMISLKKDEVYTFSADFTADKDATVRINIQENLSWSSLISEEKVISVKAGETTHVEFDTNAANGNFLTNTKIALMFGGTCENAGKTITVSNLRFYGATDKPVKFAPTYTKVSENLAVSPKGVHEDWVEWSNASVTDLPGGALFEITGYEGYEAYQTRLEQAGLNFEAGKNYVIKFDIKSTKDKTTMLRIDDLNAEYAKMCEDVSYGIKANTKTSVTVFTGTLERSSTNARVFAGLGMVKNDDAYKVGDHNVLVDYFEIYEISEEVEAGVYTAVSNNEDTAAAPVEKIEYDFSKDNSAFDFSDPGVDKDGYTLIWADEFDGNYEGSNVDANTGLNLDNWAYQLGDGSTDCGNYGWGNNELQAYTGNVENIGVNEDLSGDGNNDGLLRITAKYEENGYQYANESTKKYTSARIRTTKPGETLFTTTYGYIEARISLPETKGAWPAFWMLPEGAVYGGWPVSGEIDILESTGTQKNMGCSTVHTGSPSQVYEGSGYVELSSDIQYFHTYAVDWEPGKFTFYYDGKVIFEKSDWDSAMAGASDALTFDAPFDVPFYMLLNLAVDSGQFGGSANKASFKDDINMYVDYVRVFQREDGYSETAKKSASGEIQSDWSDYAGINQIADITESNLIAKGGGHDDAAAKGLGNWYLSTQDDANATAESYTDANGTVWDKVNITKAGGKDYSVQLIGHYDAKPGYVYKVSFDTFAEGDIAGKSVNCDSKEYKGWSTYGIQSFTSENNAKHVEFTIVQKKQFDNCRIEFNIGAAGAGTVYVSNVKVEIVDPAVVGEEAISDSKSILADGNFIYNGAFSQGANHTGYWTAKEGTTLSVPRYTTEALTQSDIKVLDIASKTNYEGLETGLKYYERRAQISAEAGLAPTIYQHNIPMSADTYTVSFDMYSKNDTEAKISLLDAEGNEAVKTTIEYKAEDGVKNYTVVLKATNDLGKGSLALTFAKGSNVQIDNVKMTAENQGPAYGDEIVNDDSNWSAYNINGEKLELVEEEGALTLDNIVSGGAWYSTQIVTDEFKLVAGVKYDLSFKFKLVENANARMARNLDLAKEGYRPIKFIVQENNGGWYAALGELEVKPEDCEIDENGFLTYSTSFMSAATINTFRVVFGFGNSEAANAKFSFKDVVLKVAEKEETVDPTDMSTPVDESVFVDDKPATDTENNNGNNAGNTGASNNESSNASGSGDSGNAANNAANTVPTVVVPALVPAALTPVRPAANESANAQEVEISEAETPLGAVAEEVKEDTKIEVSETTEEVNAPAIEENVNIEKEDTALAAAPEKAPSHAGVVVAVIAVLMAALAAVFVFLKKRNTTEQ